MPSVRRNAAETAEQEGREAVAARLVVEPYLIHCGFLTRTPRGRVATRLAVHGREQGLARLNASRLILERSGSWLSSAEEDLLVVPG